MNLINCRIWKLEWQLCCFYVESQNDEIWRFDQICAFLDDRLLVVAQTFDSVPGANKNLKIFLSFNINLINIK
jgi:hypothetical protein